MASKWGKISIGQPSGLPATVAAGYVAPQKVEHDLTDRQRQILHVLATAKNLAFAEIRARFAPKAVERAFRNELLHLKRLGLVDFKGRGRGSVWFLVDQSGPGIRHN